MLLERMETMRNILALLVINLSKWQRVPVWNAKGLTQRKEELITFLSMHNIDLTLAAEMHLTEKSYKVPLHETNHPVGAAHGGSAFLVRSDTRHHSTARVSEHYIQATLIEIADKLPQLKLSAMCSPPRHSIFAELFTDYFKAVGPKFLSGGGHYNAERSC